MRISELIDVGPNGPRPVTKEEVAAALAREDGVIVILRDENGQWPKWALDRAEYEANDLGGEAQRILDGLAEDTQATYSGRDPQYD